MKYITDKKALEGLKRAPKIMLAGEAVLATSESSVVQEGYIQQPERKVLRKGSEKHLRLWGKTDVFEEAKRAGARAIYFAPDQCVRWAAKQKKDVILFFACFSPNRQKSYVDEVVLTGGALELYAQRTLPGPDDPRFEGEMKSLFYRERGRLRHHFIYYSCEENFPKGPAPEFVKEIGLEPFKRPTEMGVDRGYGTLNLREFIPPIAILSLAVTGFFGVHLNASLEMDKLHQKFENKVAPVRDEYQQKDKSLKRLEARSKFLNNVERPDNKALALRDVAIALSRMSNLLLIDASIASASDESLGVAAMTEYEFSVTIAVLPDYNRSSIEQAEPLMGDLGKSLGASVRLKRHYERAVSLKRILSSPMFRFYELEGTFSEQEES